MRAWAMMAKLILCDHEGEPLIFVFSDTVEHFEVVISGL